MIFMILFFFVNVSLARIHGLKVTARAVGAEDEGRAWALWAFPWKSYMAHLGQATLGKAAGDKILLVSAMPSACEITLHNRKDKSTLYFLWVQTCFASKLSVTNNFLPGEMECLQAWKKKFKKKTKIFISPLHTKCISLRQTSQAICQKSHI